MNKQETVEEAATRVLYSKYHYHSPQDSGYFESMFIEGARWKEEQVSHEIKQALEKGYSEAIGEFEHWNLFSDEVLEHKTEQRILDSQDQLIKSISGHKDFNKIKECYIVRNVQSSFIFYYILHENENIDELISELEIPSVSVKNDVFTVWDLRKSSIKIVETLNLAIRKKINVNISNIFSKTNENTNLKRAIALLRLTTEYEVVESFREKVDGLEYKNNT